MAKKLNLTGLTYLKGKLDALFAKKSELPTKVSDLTNDSQFQTNTQVQTAINTALSGIVSIDFQVVTNLPSTGVKGVIYLKSTGGTNPNVYEEYIYVNNAFEKIGTTEVDLTNYWSKTELTAITTSEIDSLFS